MVYYSFVRPSVVVASGLITAPELAQAILSGQIRVISTPEGQLLDGQELVSILGLEHESWHRRHI